MVLPLLQREGNSVSSTFWRRCAALAVSAGMALGLTVATTAPALAARADVSGSWLAKQLTGGLVHNDQYDFDDYGLTADVGLALADIGGRRAELREIRRALARHVDSWTTGADFGSSDVYAGSTAKAIVLAQVTGADPRSFGGVDLVQRLNRRVSMTRPIVGRIQDQSATDYANTIGQAFAARGLARAHSPKADEVLRFLLKQQCSAGYFRLSFAPKTARSQGCDAGDRATTSAPDTDVTALAVLNLQALPRQGGAVRSAIDDAVRWLVRRQQPNGSFGGGPATEASNTNSTGLAGWALGETGLCREARLAARWVGRLQVTGDLSGTPLSGERGAIGYDRAAFQAAQSQGITVETRDQWRRATSQAAPALRNLSLTACRR